MLLLKSSYITWDSGTVGWFPCCSQVSQTLFCHPPVCFSKHLCLFLMTHPFSTYVPPLSGTQVSRGYAGERVNARWGQARILRVCLLSEILRLCQVLESEAQTVQSHLQDARTGWLLPPVIAWKQNTAEWDWAGYLDSMSYFLRFGQIIWHICSYLVVSSMRANKTAYSVKKSPWNGSGDILFFPVVTYIRVKRLLE